MFWYLDHYGRCRCIYLFFLKYIHIFITSHCFACTFIILLFYMRIKGRLMPVVVLALAPPAKFPTR